MDTELKELKPESIFYWFGEICKIPHGSGNTKMLSDFCEKFAIERSLEHYRDSVGNVVIFKKGSAGYENSAPVILQGHLDMVCDKDADCPKDMLTEGITPLTDGKYITADGTTLGADDGIAVAYVLSVLDSDNIPHPPIEALFTVDEETGMIGAEALDCSALKGRRFINIDSEKEGILTVSCAGGVRVFCEIALDMVPADGKFVKLSISGLTGGHSGIEIDKHRKNGILMLGKLLNRLCRKYSLSVCSLSGGSKVNIIPKSAEAVICCAPEDAANIIADTELIAANAKNENSTLEPNLSITAAECDGAAMCTDAASTKKAVFALMQAPDGIQAMSPDIPGMVQTSMNMGIAEMNDGRLVLSYLVRSNAAAGKQRCVEKLTSFIEYLDGKLELTSDYPAWEYRMLSPLRDVMAETYREMYGEEPEIQAIHAGLECGVLSPKLSGADMVSFGPDIENAHTPQERLGVESAARCYEYLLAVLKNLK